MIKQGVVLEQLEESWSELAPDSHLDQFKDHNVAITLARKDRFIPYKYGKKLLDNMLAINPNTTSKTTNHGHVATVLDFRVD